MCLAKSLDLPDGIVECCQRFVNAKPQMIDVISALVTTTPATPNDHSKGIATRIFLNAAEIGVGAEIIDRFKEELQTELRAVSYLQFQVSLLRCITYESNLCEVSADDGRRSRRYFEDDNGCGG